MFFTLVADRLPVEFSYKRGCEVNGMLCSGISRGQDPQFHCFVLFFGSIVFLNLSGLSLIGDFNVSVVKCICLLGPAGYTRRRAGRNICTCMHKYWHTSPTACTYTLYSHAQAAQTGYKKTQHHTQQCTDQNAAADAVWL